MTDSDLIGGRYQVSKTLRKTGFCDTFLAKDTQLPGDPFCVVKQLQPKSNEDFVLETARRLFDNEAKVLYKLGNHPQIPRLLAHLEVDDQFYLVQEFIEGKDLSQEEIASNQKPWNETDLRDFLIDVLDILSFVHQNNVIHRDIKPSNLIRQSDGKIVLIDFGAVKEITNITLTEGQSNLKELTVAIGTPGYMPIEQQNGVPNFNSDIYALGMTAIHAITGCHPDQLPRYETGEISWQERANCSPEMAEILNKMVKISSYQRYRNTGEVINDLRKLQESPSEQALRNRREQALSGSSSGTKKFNIKKIVWVTGIVTLVGIAFLIPKILDTAKALGHYNQAQQLTEEGEYEAAIAEYDQAILIKPDFAIALTNRGFAQGKLKRHFAKFNSCKQATNVAPDFPEAWNCRGLALFDLGQYESAIAEYQKAIDVDKEFYRAWFNKGEALIKLGRYEEANAATQRAVAINPGYFLAWTQMCKAYFELQQYQLAKTSCQRSLDINKDKGDAPYPTTIQLMEKIEQQLQ